MDMLGRLGIQALEKSTGYVAEYGLTQKGDPICLNEYATDILAKNMNTHVQLFEDFSTGMGPALKEEYINKNANFNDFMLKSRLGRSRLTYAFNMKCEKMYQFFSDFRQKQERHIIQIPY